MRRHLLAFAIVPLLLSGACGSPESAPSRDVHAFYYAWYATPDVDGRWEHWNHEVLLHEGIRPRYEPPVEIGASFYPEAGPYSSQDPATVDRHCRELRRAGCGVLVVSWWGPQDGGDAALPLLFEAAARHGLEIAFHLEPFRGRDAATTREALASLLGRFGEHSALHRRAGRPVCYVYDSYLSPPAEWARLLRSDGEITIRGTALDAVVIGLWVKAGDGEPLVAGGFDGYYTYFATDGFTHGSTAANWPALAAFAAAHDLLFVPCVGPGYADLRVRPWNTANQRSREEGAYYDRQWRAAREVAPAIVGVTSFNEWHEGTQIEPAGSYASPAFVYEDYAPLPPRWYLDRTRHWARLFDDEQ
jgi:glycoprotein endo-alpha-1,2-mannosidase